MILDGSQQMLEDKWMYWHGPNFNTSKVHLGWRSASDPLDTQTRCIQTDADVMTGNYGSADLVTRESYNDFRLHVEFMIMQKGGNSGVYLQNRYEVQIYDGQTGTHGMGAIINEAEAPYSVYKGLKTWNAYDIRFRAARFEHNKIITRPLVSIYFNGVPIHTNVAIERVWGGPNSGIDGLTGIPTDAPGGIKLQTEGWDVKFRNIWINDDRIISPSTAF
jgi:hypothetical protein